MSPPTTRMSSLTPTTTTTAITVITFIILSACINGVKGQDGWRATLWSTTCGVNNPLEGEYGHDGINVKYTDTVVENIRVCTFTLLDPGLPSYYIKVKVKNATTSGLPCNDSRQLFVGEANDPSTFKQICGPVSFSEVYPAGVIIQIKGDTGGEISEVEMDVMLFEVDYLSQCNRTWYQIEKRIDMDLVLDPDEYLLLPYHCFWKFHTPDNYNRLIVDIHSVDLIGQDEEGKGCQNNSLVVIDGWEPTHRKEIETCNSTAMSYTTSANSAYISVTIVDPGQQFLAFNFSVSSFSITQCYGQIITLKATSENKYITSPGYPDSIYEHLNCQWKIESDDDHQVEIEFVDLDLTSFDCENDYVNVFDGPDQSSLLLASVCRGHRGGDPNKKYRSSGGMFLVQFKTNDYNTQGRGFKIRYYTKAEASTDLVPDTTCRRNPVHLTATSTDKFLEPFSRTNPYYPNADCTWIIQSNDNPIEVEIQKLFLESSNYCYRDSLDIYDGTDMDASPLTSACGPIEWLETGTKFRSSGKALTIHFKSDWSLQKEGFKLKYNTKAQPSTDLAAVASCRGKIEYLNSTMEIQNLTSPDYPSNYPPFEDCRWRLQADDGNTTTVDIVMMDLEAGASNVNCVVHDYVEVFDGPDVLSKSLGKVCEGTRSFESSGRDLTIRFLSNKDGSGKGFKLQYYMRTPDTLAPTTTTSIPRLGDGGKQNQASIVMITMATCMTAMLILANKRHS